MATAASRPDLEGLSPRQADDALRKEGVPRAERRRIVRELGARGLLNLISTGRPTVHDITITGLTRIHNAKPNKGGSTVLAYFDCEANGFRLAGMAFARTAKNGLAVWPPKLEGPESARRSITIVEDSLRHAIMLQARETYRALGGEDAEWVGSSVPMAPAPSEPEPLSDDDTTAGVARFLGAAA